MRHSRIVVIALCGALSLGGCGGGDDDGGDSPDRAATPTATSAQEETAEETATATPGEAGAADDVAEEPVAEQTVKGRGEYARDTTVDLAVQGLQVDGELATLTLSFTPHDANAEPDTEYSVEELGGERYLFVSLLDSVNLKRYAVVEDSSGDKVETRAALARVPLDASITTQHTFAAPPPDVREIDVSVGDWPMFRDVPIER